MRFNYQARTKLGEIQTGIVEASDKEAAYEALKNRGLFVTALEEASAPFYARKLKIFERITGGDIVLFSRQLAIMFKSKVPLTEVFQTLAQQTRNQNFRDKILKLAEEVEGGMPLSKALAIFPKLFSSFYVSMVKSGEATGRLSDIFIYLADYLEKEHRFRSKIIGAMIYPIFILCVFIIIGTIILVYVLPQLTSLLEEAEEELPWATRVVISTSNLMRTRGWVILLIFIALIIAAVKVIKMKPVQKFIHRNLLRVPIINSFLMKIYLARFALNLSTLISGGLPIAQCLEITSEVIGNDYYKNIILKTRDGVKRGETISSILERYPDAISPFFYQLVIVGEKTGTLDSSLLNLVDFYQESVERALDGFIRLLEPIFIILLGIIVAIMLVAVLMPLYSIGLA